MESAQPQEVVDFLLAHQIIPPSFVQDLGSDLSRFPSSAAVIDELVQCGRLTEFQQLKLLAGQGKDLIFGQYRLVKPLGKGGMGEVFKAWQPRLHRFIALKFVQKEYMDEHLNAHSRFVREANAIAQLQHANVVVLHDADEINGVPFIVMELIDGASLADLVHRNGPLGVRQACEYMRQAGLGLQHAFECGFIHRDIKPSNIMVSQPRKKGSSVGLKSPSLVTVHDLKRMAEYSGAWSSHQVKILDMGLARLHDSLTSSQVMVTPLTATGAVVGTPDFLSPEQARNPSKVDIRADLYSLGCTFYFILSGQPPFPGGTPIEKLLKHQFESPAPLDTLRRGIPESVKGIVDRLLAKQAEERFQTPLELVLALTKFLATAAAEPEIHPPANVVTQLTFPSLILPPKSACLTLVEKAADLERTRDDESPEGSLQENLGGLTTTPIPWDQIDALESKSTARNLEVGRTPAPLLSDMGTFTSIARLEGHIGVVSGVAVTRDGRLAVSGDVNGHIRIWDLNDPIPREIGHLSRREEIQSVAFAPGPSNDVFIGELRQGKGALVRWNWRSGLFLDWDDGISLNQKSIGCLSFTPDGKMLAAAVGARAVTWCTGNGTATNRKVYQGLDKPIRALAITPDGLLLAAVGQDKSIHFWDLKRGRWNHNSSIRVNLQGATITTMGFSPDGTLLALAGLDTGIVLWSMVGDEVENIRVLQGHSSNLLCVQFVDDGSHLVSVGADGQILFWDVATASIVREFRLDLTMALGVMLSGDATRMVAGFASGVVGIYGLDAPTKHARSQEVIPTHRGQTFPAMHAKS